MDNSGIDYRERSPLVVPPKLDLPPPASASAEVKAPNWPKDPDEARRKAMIAARKKDAHKDAVRRAAMPRILSPSELNKRTDGGRQQRRHRGVRTARRLAAIPARTPILSPSQLGYNGGFSGLFKGNKAEVAPFKGEPDARNPDDAAARLPDAVAELRLRNRAEGIAEQGIQPGRRQVRRVVIAIWSRCSLGFVTRARDAVRDVRISRYPAGRFCPAFHMGHDADHTLRRFRRCARRALQAPPPPRTPSRPSRRRPSPCRTGCRCW